LESKLTELFSFSVTKPYDSGKPHFTDIILYESGKEIFYFSVDELYIYLSDDDIIDLTMNHHIDIGKWDLMKEKNNYNIPEDYFTLTVYQLCDLH